MNQKNILVALITVKMLNTGLLLLILAVVAYGHENSGLPFRRNGQKTYFIGSHQKATFLQAMKLCDSLSMKLLSIDSKEEHDTINQYISEAGHGSEYWTSGTNMLDNRNYIWMSTGKTLQFSKWDDIEPSNSNEKCIQLLARGDDVVWNDIDCNKQMNFICQKDNKIYTKQVVAANPSYSPNINLLQYNGKSYYFSRDNKGTFLEAAYFCRKIQMTLATIISEEENEVIGKYIRDADISTTWWTSGNSVLDNVWRWFPTGHVIGFTNWDANQPTNNDNAKCLSVFDSKENGLLWMNSDCEEKHTFICEKTDPESLQRAKRDAEEEEEEEAEIDNQAIKESEPVQVVEDLVEGTTVVPEEEDLEPVAASDEDWLAAINDTPPGFITFSYNAGKKYHVEVELLGTQKQAKVFCEYHNMQLLAIESELENQSTEKVLEDVGEEGPFWIAGRKPEAYWRWLRINRPIVFHNMEDKTPLSNNNKTCITILLTGEWRFDRCDAVRPFICEVSEDEVPDTVDPEAELIGSLTAAPAHLEETKVCSLPPIVNVYIDNNLVSSGVNPTPELLGAKHEADGAYSVNIVNSF